jgi:hypothetical protein
MPTYLITDSHTGRKLKLTGDSPPTDQESEEEFARLPPLDNRTATAIKKYYDFSQRGESDIRIKENDKSKTTFRKLAEELTSKADLIDKKMKFPIENVTIPVPGNYSLNPLRGPATALTMAANVPQNIKKIAQPLLHPIDTIKSIGMLSAGAGDALSKKIGMDSDFNDPEIKAISESMYGPEYYNESQKNQELSRKAFDTFSSKINESVKKSIDDPMGIPKRINDYAIENPVDSLFMVSGALGLGGKVSKVSSLTQAAETLNPISIVLKASESLLKKPLTSLGESLYARVLKIPPGRLNQAVRQEVTQNLIKEGLPLNKNTVNKINNIVFRLEESISGGIENASKGGTKININSAINNLNNLKLKYKNTLSPETYYKAIDNAKIELINHDFMDKVIKSKITLTPSTILDQYGKPIMIPKIQNIKVPTGTVDIALSHQLKKGVYKELQKFYMDRNRPAAGTQLGNRLQAGNEAKAEIAKTLRQEILDNPDVPSYVKRDLRREAGLVNAKKWVELATNRGGNHDPISLGGMAFGIMVDKGLPSAAAWRIAMSQPSVSRLAILSDRIGRKSGFLFNIGAEIAPEISTAIPFLKSGEQSE